MIVMSTAYTYAQTRRYLKKKNGIKNTARPKTS